MTLLNGILNGVMRHDEASFEFTLENCVRPRQWDRARDTTKVHITVTHLEEGDVHFLRLSLPSGVHEVETEHLTERWGRYYLVDPSSPLPVLKLQPAEMGRRIVELKLSAEVVQHYTVWLDSVMERHTLAPSWATTMPALRDRLDYDSRIERWDNHGGYMEVFLRPPYYWTDPNSRENEREVVVEYDDLYNFLRAIERIDYDNDIEWRVQEGLNDNGLNGRTVLREYGEAATQAFADAVERLDMHDVWEIVDHVTNELQMLVQEDEEFEENDE